MTVPARPLPDAEARRLAQTQLDRPLVLEAGAGTGKTTTLVARILAWSLGPGWERAEARLAEAETGDRGAAAERLAARVLGGVVALTFTEAAAAEMAERVGRELAGLAAGDPPPEWLHLESEGLPLLAAELWRMRAEALVSTLDHLTVTTIHAWCLGLLSTYPLEAGLHPRLTVDADFRRTEEVVAETVETALGRAYARWGGDEGAGADSEVFLDLAARGIGPGEIAEALGVLVREGVDPARLEDDPGAPGTCRELQQGLAESGRQLLQTALVPLEAAPPKKAMAAQRAIRAVRDLLEHLGDLDDSEEGPTPVALEAEARRFSPAALDRLKTWAKAQFTDTEASALGEGRLPTSEAARALLKLLSHAADLERLSLAHRALAPLLRAARREMRSRGVVTFQDLLQGAADLLTGGKAIHRAIASRVRRKIDQLLVDEFQDTDALQCRILHALALEGPAAERPGLFLVGDPKQSIYGWRNADLAAYGAFVRAVEEAGGVRRPLLTNFRSTPALLDEVTRIVEPVMQEETDFQPPFEPLLPSPELDTAPPFSAGGRHAVEHWISWHREHGPETRNADADRVEAEAVAGDLRHLHHTEGTAWRSMALLFRSTTQLEPYLEALRRAGVPFQVNGDRQYYRRREVIEAAALVRTVLDPGDALALLTVLRSSMVGVPDAALLPLWRRDLPQRVLGLLGDGPEEARQERLAAIAATVREAAAEVPSDIPGLDRLAGWPDALIAALTHLAAARRSFREDPVDLFVARLRDLFLPEPIEAARYLGAYRLANLERFFRRLAEGLEEGGDAGAVLRRLRRSVAEAQEVPESPPAPGAADAVQVLTVHGAKGLEFEHVYLVQLHRASGGGSGPDTEVLRGGERLALRLLGAAGAGFAELDERRRRVEEAEQVRLLYVAVTRAKQRLVLAGSPGGSSFGRGRPITELLARRQDRPEDLESLWRRTVEALETGRAPTPHRDSGGVLWRFPGLVPSLGQEPAPQGLHAPPPAGLPDAARVARDARRLATRRVWATQRQNRPLSAAASEEAHDRLRELLSAASEPTDGENPDGAAPYEADPSERLRRMEVGSAIHAALEQLDLGRLVAGEVKAELGLRRKALEADLARRLPPAELPAACERGRDLLRRFAEGPLLDRLVSLADCVLAREMAVLLPAAETDPEDQGLPLGFLAGAIDLLYRDRETGELVVVDFKTDEVDTEQQIVDRARAYVPQGEIYRRAVREALGLPAPPRFELWFLHPGRVVGMG